MIIVTDISKAFDNVDIGKLQKVLRQTKLEVKYINAIMTFLCNRTNIHKLNYVNTKIFQFADDFTIVINAKMVSEINNIAKNALLRFNKILEELNLKLHVEKCKTIIFKQDQIYNQLLDINMNNNIIRNTNTVQILGITLAPQI